jgi:uncharacterized protein involved in propanediol utilization
MGAKIERLKRFANSIGSQLVHSGKAVGKVLENMEQKDRELEEKMKKAMGSAQ